MEYMLGMQELKAKYEAERDALTSKAVSLCLCMYICMYVHGIYARDAGIEGQI